MCGTPHADRNADPMSDDLERGNENRADALLSRWVDLLDSERDRHLTPTQEQAAYADLHEYIYTDKRRKPSKKTQ
jgi:hypothetical protein